MKISEIEQIHVTRSLSTEYCLGWTINKMRYHVWLDCKTRRMHDDTIYKNPPEGVQHRGPGYFPTRHLKASDKVNQRMMAYVLNEAARLDLFAIADHEKQIKDDHEAALQRERARVYRIKEAGPVLYSALRHLVDAARLHEAAHDHPVGSEVLWAEIDAAFNIADKS